MIIVKKKYERGFTLLEVMIAILIIGIIASITIVNHMDESRSKAEFANLKTKWVINEGKYIEKLIGKWSFDEKEGLIARDSSTYERNGQLISNPVRKDESECIEGGCLEFNGSNYVSLPFFDISMPFTFSAWFIKTESGNKYLFQGNNSLGDTRNLINVNTTMRLDQYRPSGGGANGSIPIELGKWYNVVVVYQLTNWKVYVNGKLDIDISAPEVYSGGVIDNWLIGTRLYPEYCRADSFKGKIDEVSLYEGMMSVSQIRENYVAGLNALLSKGSIDYEGYSYYLASSN